MNCKAIFAVAALAFAAVTTPVVSHAQQAGDNAGREFRDNGFRGWNERHNGHRFYRGYWYPNAAFSITIVPRPIYRSNPRYLVTLPARHVSWCENRYRTYRVYDNSYAYRVGLRTSCRSPYFR